MSSRDRSGKPAKGKPVRVSGLATDSPAAAKKIKILFFIFILIISTGSKTKVLDGGVAGGFTWLEAVTYYDNKGRPVQTVSDNYKGGIDRTTTVLDFVGKALETKTTHNESDVTWKDQVGVSLIGNRLTRTATTTAGAASTQVLGANQNGWLEVIVSETNTNRYIGFNDTNPDVNATNIDYAFYLNNATLIIIENNVTRLTQTGVLKPGDVLRIERTGSTINYYRNGAILPYTRTGALTTALMVDASLQTNNATLIGVRTSFSTTTRTVTRRMQYDHAGRLTRAYHLIGSNPADEVLLTQNEYNEVGQLVDKKLHSKDNGSTFKQSVDYRYNIRGWMSSMNNSSLVNDGGATNDDTNDLFGMNLLYNTVASGINNVADYTGNISALVWSNYLGQTGIKERGYKFDYDALNRLSAATHVEKTATWATSTSLHEDNLTYDLNSNIKTLNRKGAAASGLDNMVYNYGSGTTLSNKVLSITDNGDKNKGFLDQNTTGNDYTYDNNGSQLTDKNKGITATVYNHFNQPTRVTIANGDYMTYVYDGEGKRLGKWLYTAANLLKRQTDYVGDFVYENDTLKFICTEEGRTMMTGASPEYQYELRDNKDNVRVMFTSKDETDAAAATYEPANATVEQNKFLRYINAKLVNSSFFDRTNGSAPTQTLGYAQRLNGSANEKYGLARSISVMPGDVISAEVYAKYVDPNSTNWNGALTTLMGNIASSAAGVVVDGVNYSTSTSSFPVSYPGLVTKTDTGAPKAYLNWLVFDRDFVFITGGFQQISTASREIGNDVAHERLASPNISITQPGYVYIYVSNENATPIDCYFDDLKVTQIKSLIVQTNTYYPFGMDIPSLSYGREGNKKNNYLYNGRSDLQDDLGLNNYFTPLRIQETDAPRWWQVDPVVENMYDWTPYSYSFNNPIRYNDPKGDCPPDNPNCNSPSETLHQIAEGVGSFFSNLFGGNSQQALNSAAEVMPGMYAFKTMMKAENGQEVSSGEYVKAGVDLVFLNAAIMGAVAEGGAKPVADTAPAPFVAKSNRVATAAEVVTKPSKPYTRPSGATTPEMRKYVNEVGKETGCAKCGQKTDKYYAGHKKDLSKEYYETGKIDLKKMKTNSAVQPECASCSNKGGREQQKYVKKKNKELGFQ